MAFDVIIPEYRALVGFAKALIKFATIADTSELELIVNDTTTEPDTREFILMLEAGIFRVAAKSPIRFATNAVYVGDPGSPIVA